VAIAEAKKELSDLENQSGSSSLAQNLDYQLAQDKVTNLNARLENLTEQLGSLIGVSAETTVSDYLVAGNPSTPVPVLPERGRARNTLIMGAVLGIVVAWVVLNFRWIIKGMPSAKTSTLDDGDEDS
jgi:LPS O-antigen subunit length determinant protein (WzzB/FepE family)